MPPASLATHTGARWDHFFLVLDHAVETRVFLAIGDTSSHARIDVREQPGVVEQLSRVFIVANVVVHSSTFEVLGTTRTRANHVRASRVYDRHIK